MKSKNQKLTMVSVMLKGRTRTTFVLGEVLPNGKTIVPSTVIEKLCHNSGCIARGLTYSIG